ncbi:unnamed protein product [Phytophthora fragariaefolia]|uniref:Unnamed protein product n=1 Tax=Phytophthora fragariaefolia TaxID=1490495 RepID=A0A9W6TQS5_9STRA|nr:unnamed protein product [Phytophthora fragariaefolia]
MMPYSILVSTVCDGLQALQCLFEGEFDVPKAVGLLHAARRERFKARRDRDERLPSEEFKDAVAVHGKKFHLKALRQKVTTREVVSNYYLWKRTPEFRVWRLHQTAKKTKKKKRGETELLRQRADDADEDPEVKAFLRYHNEYCELCATGGKLLCCDGCARAYHFSCVQPPITKIPCKDEDWFCAHCQKAFGGPKPNLVPSEYGFACAPFPGVARSLSEVVTDASSYEDDDDCSDDEDDDEDEEDSESNDELASDHGSNTSNFPSKEELSANAGKSGSFTDNESDRTSAKILSSSPGAATNSSLAQQPSLTEDSPAQKQQTRAEIQPAGQPSGSFQAPANRPVEDSIESSQAGREKKRSKEAKRLARLRPGADQHREYCEVCLKDGKLLCCDGCERAYHLNCVRPALLDVPEGDWFCSHCRGTPSHEPPAKTGGNLSAPGPTKAASKPKTKANGCSLKGGIQLPTVITVHDAKEKAHTKALETKKTSEQSKPTVTNEPDFTSAHVNSDKLSTNDAISDITTESESDGGVAKVFQSLSPSSIISIPSRKRRKKHAKVEARVSHSRYTSPSRSLENLSCPLQPVRREILPLRLESGSGRKHKRRRDMHPSAPPTYAMGV